MIVRLVLPALLALVACPASAAAEDFDGNIEDNNGCPAWCDPSEVVYRNGDRLEGTNNAGYRVDYVIKDADGNVLLETHLNAGDWYSFVIPQGATVAIVSRSSREGSGCAEQERALVRAPEAVPTVSQWGAIVMALLLLTGGTLLNRRVGSECDCVRG